MLILIPSVSATTSQLPTRASMDDYCAFMVWHRGLAILVLANDILGSTEGNSSWNGVVLYHKPSWGRQATTTTSPPSISLTSDLHIRSDFIISNIQT